MFPGAGAEIYYNEAGEVLGWDYPDIDFDDPDTDAWYGDDSGRWEDDDDDFDPDFWNDEAGAY